MHVGACALLKASSEIPQQRSNYATGIQGCMGLWGIMLSSAVDVTPDYMVAGSQSCHQLPMPSSTLKYVVANAARQVSLLGNRFAV